MRTLPILLAAAVAALAAPAQSIEILPLDPTSDDLLELAGELEVPLPGIEIDEIIVERDGFEVTIDVFLEGGSINPFGLGSNLDFEAEIGELEPGDYTALVRVHLEGEVIFEDTYEFTVQVGDIDRLEDLLDHLVNDGTLDYDDANGDGVIDVADIVTAVNSLNAG